MRRELEAASLSGACRCSPTSLFSHARVLRAQLFSIASDAISHANFTTTVFQKASAAALAAAISIVILRMQLQLAN